MTDRDRDPDDHRPHGRVPPHDLRAEASILGAALLSERALEVLGTALRPGDFYKPEHQAIAAAMIDLFEARATVDTVTLAHRLNQRGGATVTDGRLVEIMAAAPNTSGAAGWATIVHDLATLRRLLGAAGAITEIGYASPTDAHEAIDRARILLDGVASQNGSRSYSSLEIPQIGDLLDGNLDPETGDFLTRADGLCLLYAGKMHTFQGEPGSGKTWIALLAVLEVLALGGSAVYLDWEDSSRGVLGRLLALGAEPAAVRSRFHYVQPSGAFGTSETMELERLLERTNPDVVILDGVAEALSRDGLSEDKAAEVVRWIEKLPRPISRTGAAVLMLDHVGKDREARGRWARGSGAKLGAIDGAAYQIDVVKSFSRKSDGLVKLTIAKDRPGGVGAQKDVAALARIEPHADGASVKISLEIQTVDKTPRQAWRPTGLMRRVSEELEKSEVPLTASAVKSMIHTDKKSLVVEAISRLIAEGYVGESRQGSTKVLVLRTPYHGDDPGPGDPPAGADDPPPPALFDPEDVPEVTNLDEWKDRNL